MNSLPKSNRYCIPFETGSDLQTFAKSILKAAFVLTLFGCAGPLVTPQALKPNVEKAVMPPFVAVTAEAKDTLASLAGKYLGDASLDWRIAEFNDIKTVSPGQKLIIPLESYDRGGITPRRYQVVPVLSYHQFSRTRKNKMTVTAADFEAQMRYLKANGYRVISLDQLFDFLDFRIQIPQKSVVITIDDGWRSTYDIAYPILKQYGFPATLFVYTNLITGSPKTLSWDLAREMAQNGIEMQCHTVTHRDLTKMNDQESFAEYFDALNRELTASTKILEEKMGIRPNYLAYPYGETNRLVIALLKKHGYRGAFTVKRGPSPFFFSNYRINRSMIYGDMPLKRFEKNLTTSSSEALR